MAAKPVLSDSHVDLGMDGMTRAAGSIIVGSEGSIGTGRGQFGGSWDGLA